MIINMLRYNDSVDGNRYMYVNYRSLAKCKFGILGLNLRFDWSCSLMVKLVHGNFMGAM